MKRFSEEFKKKADGLMLSTTEKDELRSRLLSYIEYHPLPGNTQPARAIVPVRSRVASFVGNFHIVRTVSALAVVLIASIPVLAENAVPGDVLYPVKVRINEEVQGSLVRSPYAKVEWETERIERRLAEARLLADEGKLTPEVEVEVANAVREHSEAAQEGIATLRVSDSDEAALAEITLSSALDVQSEMLEGRSDTLATAVDTALQVAKESQQNNRPSYEKLLARIENETTRAYELMSTIENETTERERNEIKRRMREIEHRVEHEIELSEESPEEAVALLTTDLADLRKLISFMTNIDVRANVTIEDLVPNEQTEEERIAVINERLADTATLEVQIRERVRGVDENTQLAIDARLAEIAGHVAATETAIAEGTIDAADEASHAAYDAAQEVIEVLDGYDAEMGNTEEATTTPATSTNATSTGV